MGGAAHFPRIGATGPAPYHAAMQPDQPDAATILALVDWRRRVAELYAEVRRLSAVDPRAAWDLWRAEREALYRGHASSPVRPPDRAAFRASHWPYDPRWRLSARLDPPPAAASPDPAPAGSSGLALAIPASVGAAPPMEAAGIVEVAALDRTIRLPVFRLREYSTGLFLPFRDTTNGTATYGAGRYLLDTAKGADLGGDPVAGTLILDFNFAYQPSCAFDPVWSCPLAPPSNRLDVAVEAGERLR